MKRVVVFARAPRAGAVKTRLSPALPAALAAKFYAAMLADTLAAAARCGADERAIAWASADATGEPHAGLRSCTQRDGDLGARLEGALAAALATPGDRAIVVGSDCPAILATHLDAAFDALAAHDVVIGPAGDGGYWLIGLARPAPALFRDIPWSTGKVTATTREYATALGLEVAMLPTLADIDTPADLARLVGDCVAASGASACGEHTRAALRALGLLP